MLIQELAHSAPPVATLGGALVFSVLAWLLYRLRVAPLSKVPGPWYTNLTGLVLQYHAFKGDMRLWIHHLHEHYGTAVRIAPNEVSFASSSAIKDIYIANGGLVKTELYSLFRQGGHTNLFTALGNAEHKEKKRRYADRYSNSSVLQPEVQSLLHERANMFARKCGEAKSVDIYVYLHCYALDCVSGATFHPYGTKSIEAGEEDAMVKSLSYHDSRRILVIAHYYPSLLSLYKKMTTMVKKGGSGSLLYNYAWDSILRPAHAPFTLATRLRSYVVEKDIPNGSISKSYNLAQNKAMTVADVVAECLDHVGAGIDTTGDTLCFLMYELSLPENADKLKKLSTELCEAKRKTENEKTDGQQHNFPRLETLPYLDAVLHEALRLWAPGTQPLPRYIPTGGRCIDGYALPVNTIVSCQSYTLHRYDGIAFPDAYDFQPERWLAGNKTDEQSRLYFAFGAGPRMCIGKNLAMTEMRCLLYNVYTRYRTQISEDMNSSMEMSDQVLTSRPKGLFCKLTFEPLDG